MPEFLIFVFGACLASYLYTLAERRAWQIRQKYSICNHCQKRLSWYELLPIVSFLIQLGRCRHCRKKIPWRYPLLEITNGLILLLLYFKNQNSLLNFALLTFNFELLFFLAYDDSLTMEMSNTGLIGLAILIIFQLVLAGQLNLGHLYGALLAAGFIALLYFFSRGRLIGSGDIILAGVLGFWLGFPLAGLLLYLAFILGGVMAGILLIFKKKKLKDPVAFAPFLALASFLVLFWGEQILRFFWL